MSLSSRTPWPDQTRGVHDARRSRLRRGLPAVIALGGIIAVYVWIVSAGTFTNWPIYSSYYNLLADAFSHGQIDLLVKPAPELLALPDPYDPSANAPYRLHDAVLFNGKYYLCWGPVPGLIVAALKLAGVSRGISDTHLVFGFMIGTAIFSTLLVLTLRRQFFSNLPEWSVIPVMLVAALNPAMTWLLSRGAVYEAAISGGQLFLMAGLYWAFTALQDSPGPKTRRLLLAGAALALAVGSRISLAPAVMVFALLVMLRIFLLTRGDPRRVLSIRALAAFVAPLLLGALGLALYNYLRFGSFSETGLGYQLAGVNQHSAINTYLFSTAYVVPNLFLYLFCGINWISKFPFMLATGYAPSAFPSWLSIPAGYLTGYTSTEPVASMLSVSPFLWFGAIPVLLLALKQSKALFHKHRQPAQGYGQASPSLEWYVLSLTAVSLLSALPSLMMNSATMRYEADFSTPIVLLAGVGMWQGWRWSASRPKRKRAYAALAVVLALFSCLSGVLLSFTGYPGHFENHNPQLFATLSQLRAPFLYKSATIFGSSYILTDRTGFPLPQQATGVSSIGPYRVLKLPAENCVFINDVKNGNGINDVKSSADRIQFWLGQGDTQLAIVSGKEGQATVSANFAPGPSLPERPDRKVLVLTDQGDSQLLTITRSGLRTFVVPVAPGLNHVVLRPLDLATVRILPNGDTRPLLVFVSALKIGFDKPAPTSYDSVMLRMKISFSRQPKYPTEPIVTTGHQNAGDFVFVRYLPNEQVAFGFDDWGQGGPEGKPVSIEPGRVYDMEVDLNDPPGVVTVTLNGHELLRCRSNVYPTTREEITVGANRITGTVTGPSFSGTVTEVNY